MIENHINSAMMLIARPKDALASLDSIKDVVRGANGSEQVDFY